MKTKSRITFLAFCLTAGVGASAQNDQQSVTDSKAMMEKSFSVYVIPVNDTTFKIEVVNPDKKRLNINISHQVLGTMVDTVISNDRYVCRYRMQEAEDGKYTISVRNGREKIERTLEQTTTVSVDRRLQIN